MRIRHGYGTRIRDTETRETDLGFGFLIAKNLYGHRIRQKSQSPKKFIRTRDSKLPHCFVKF